ncbi:uncharacterized protein LAJ45_04519 [Morchella importuna]|uniref:uncharacterized protein n=1 Tax=Morchella importuna TaxID=1174673 RepID=UPI001E8D24FC|nr:uncharacterized protein LAJ45_04519 [Morchella importuna]KAH8151317.1 hypothetical protein LAJ45_04519 [Morchella importuna]
MTFVYLYDGLCYLTIAFAPYRPRSPSSQHLRNSVRRAILVHTVFVSCRCRSQHTSHPLSLKQKKTLVAIVATTTEQSRAPSQPAPIEILRLTPKPKRTQIGTTT